MTNREIGKILPSKKGVQFLVVNGCFVIEKNKSNFSKVFLNDDWFRQVIWTNIIFQDWKASKLLAHLT